MEYNTQRKPLALGEYGRYVQEMVEHTMSIEDREERNKAAQAIIQLMTVMNPSYKGNDELINKLWDDLYIMSKFQLDVDSPYPKPEPAVNIQAEKIEYPKGDFKYRHYGKSIENLIEVAKAIEDKDEQQALTQLIAHLMKRSYLNYNRDSVNEEMIIDQLKEMSGGLLKLNDNFRFQHTNDILGSQPRNSSKSSSKSRSKRKWKK
ncbi:MAG TPA: DUF4290 domain-containing protein [Flavobacteriales bacterium]|nr:DUF4290 domain-containing protein [Flavobacteriales bacterium]